MFLLAGAVGALGLSAPPAHASSAALSVAPDPTPTKLDFANVNGDTWIVPAGVRSIDVRAWGSAGGGGGPINIPGTAFVVSNDGPGGAGADIRATLQVTPGETLKIYASTPGGGTGSRHNPGAGGLGFIRGGSGGTGSLAGSAGGGGGGASAIVNGKGIPLVVAAGGGGGAGHGGAFVYCNGGAGGAANQNGQSADGWCAGGAPGADSGVIGPSGAAGTGGGGAGNSSSGGGGGGGGGGWLSGSGALGSRVGGAGGGGGAGGSSYVDPTASNVIRGYNAGSGWVSFWYTPDYATKTSVVATANPSIFGTPGGYVATVVNSDLAGVVPSGEVAVTDNRGTELATTPVDAAGTANIRAIDLPAGSHDLAFTYRPRNSDSYKFQSSTASLTQLVKPLATRIVNATVSAGLLSKPATITGTVSADSAPATAIVTTASSASSPAVPTGQVTLSLNGNVLGTAPLDSRGDFTTAIPWAEGSRTVQLSYDGDTNFRPAEPVTVQVNAARAQAAVLLVPSSPSVLEGRTVDVRVSVTASSSLPVQPGGTILLTVDNRVRLPEVTLVSGSAAVTLPALSVGNHEIKVDYSGDTYFLPASGAPASIAVTAPVVPTVPAPVPAAAVPAAPGPASSIAALPAASRASFGILANTGSNGPAFAGLGLGAVAALVLGLFLRLWSRPPRRGGPGANREERVDLPIIWRHDVTHGRTSGTVKR